MRLWRTFGLLTCPGGSGNTRSSMDKEDNILNTASSQKDRKIVLSSATLSDFFFSLTFHFLVCSVFLGVGVGPAGSPSDPTERMHLLPGPFDYPPPHLGEYQQKAWRLVPSAQEQGYCLWDSKSLSPFFKLCIL